MIADIVNSAFNTTTLAVSGNKGRVIAAFLSGSGTYGVTDPTNVTFNGQAMTKIWVTASNRTLAAAWYYVVPDDLAAGNYVLSGTSLGRVMLYELSGVNLIAPVLDYQGVSSSSTGATSLTTPAIAVKKNCLVLDLLKNEEDPSKTPGVGQIATANFSGRTWALSKKYITMTGTTTMSWTFGSNRGSLLAVAFGAIPTKSGVTGVYLSDYGVM